MPRRYHCYGQKPKSKAAGEGARATLSKKDYPAALELRKLYQVVAGPAAATHHQLRVIDESGEDYLASISLLRGPFDDRRRKKGQGA